MILWFYDCLYMSIALFRPDFEWSYILIKLMVMGYIGYPGAPRSHGSLSCPHFTTHPDFISWLYPKRILNRWCILWMHILNHINEKKICYIILYIILYYIIFCIYIYIINHIYIYILCMFTIYMHINTWYVVHISLVSLPKKNRSGGLGQCRRWGSMIYR